MIATTEQILKVFDGNRDKLYGFALSRMMFYKNHAANLPWDSTDMQELVDDALVKVSKTAAGKEFEKEKYIARYFYMTIRTDLKRRYWLWMRKREVPVEQRVAQFELARSIINENRKIKTEQNHERSVATED